MNTFTYSAAIVTIDKGFTITGNSSRALAEMLKADGWNIVYTAVISCDPESIKAELIRLANIEKVPLILTIGGTGMTVRDNTPEATSAVIERFTPGFSELIRAESYKLTSSGILGRGVSGILGNSLIINIPGSERAAPECLRFIMPLLKHAFQMMSADSVEHSATTGTVLAVCLSERKGEQKTPQPSITLLPEHGVAGDAHAGMWHRQVSLLSKSSVDTLQAKVDIQLTPGIFAENILLDGIDVKSLPIGTKLSIGDAVLEVTQIGKECHADCIIRQKAGDCVMPREGVFARVLQGGTITVGTAICLS